jgi:hypothetical protein
MKALNQMIARTEAELHRANGPEQKAALNERLLAFRTTSALVGDYDAPDAPAVLIADLKEQLAAATTPKIIDRLASELHDAATTQLALKGEVRHARTNSPRGGAKPERNEDDDDETPDIIFPDLEERPSRKSAAIEPGYARALRGAANHLQLEGPDRDRFFVKALSEPDAPPPFRPGHFVISMDPAAMSAPPKLPPTRAGTAHRAPKPVTAEVVDPAAPVISLGPWHERAPVRR